MPNVQKANLAPLLAHIVEGLRACLVEPSNPQTLKAVLRVEKCQFLALLRVEKQGQRLEPSNPTLKLL